jgi:hypothetical protein
MSIQTPREWRSVFFDKDVASAPRCLFHCDLILPFVRQKLNFLLRSKKIQFIFNVSYCENLCIIVINIERKARSRNKSRIVIQLRLKFRLSKICIKNISLRKPFFSKLNYKCRNFKLFCLSKPTVNK